MREEYAKILDFLPRGYARAKRQEPIAQAITTTKFVLLELIPKEGKTINIGEKVYIGPGERDKIRSILGRIPYSKLTGTAVSELQKAVEEIVTENEKRFVEFYNKAESISIREHQLDLLPGLGKKSLWDFLEERKKGEFKSFEDIKKRVPSFPDPKKLIIKGILQELEGNEKKYLFVEVYIPKPRKFQRRGFRRRF